MTGVQTCALPIYSRQPSADPISLLRQIEERLSTFYVGSMPDVDLDDLAARSAIYYTPEHFLQGVIARAIAHAREIQRPVRVGRAVEREAPIDESPALVLFDVGLGKRGAIVPPAR